MLGSPATRASFLQVVDRSDPLIGDALQTVIDRGDFIPVLPDDAPGGDGPGPAKPPAWAAPATIETDPAIPAELTEAGQAANEALRRDIAGKSGPELLDFILADFAELKRILFRPRSSQAIMAGMQAAWRLNELLAEWLGETNAVDPLTQSAPGNVTAEMGLALLDVADVIRPHPEVVAFLERIGLEDAVTTRTTSTSCPRSRAGPRPGRPSRPTWTSTACAASARSTSRGRGGANAQPRSYR